MKLLRFLITAAGVAAGLATAALADNPTGVWKIVATGNGQVMSAGSVALKLTLKDGKLTGAIEDADNGREQTILNPSFKDDIISFTFFQDQNTTQIFRTDDPVTDALMGRVPPGVNETGFRTTHNLGLKSILPDMKKGLNDHTNKDVDTADIRCEFSGKVIGNTFLGNLNWQRTPPPPARPPDNLTVTGNCMWTATRVTPDGIWDVTMGSLAGTLTRQPMQLAFRDGKLGGTWLAPGKDGNLRPVPVQSGALDNEGCSFTIVDQADSGKTVYEFDGSYMGGISDFTATRLTLGFGQKSVTSDNAGPGVEVMTGTMKVTGPDGTIHKSSWKAIRWKAHAGDRFRTDVDVGTPYEVRNPPKPKP